VVLKWPKLPALVRSFSVRSSLPDGISWAVSAPTSASQQPAASLSMADQAPGDDISHGRQYAMISQRVAVTPGIEVPISGVRKGYFSYSSHIQGSAATLLRPPSSSLSLPCSMPFGAFFLYSYVSLT
jgi:hypothetical protein